MIDSISDYKKARSEEEIKVAVEGATFPELMHVVSEIREDKKLERTLSNIPAALWGVMGALGGAAAVAASFPVAKWKEITSLPLKEYMKHPASIAFAGFSGVVALGETFLWRDDINKEDALRYADRAVAEKIERDIIDGLEKELNAEGIEMPPLNESVGSWKENIEQQRIAQEASELQVG